MADKPIRVLDYIDNYAVPFFANQVHFDRFGYYVNGEFSHHEEGLWEELEEEFSTNDRDHIRKILTYIKSKPSRNQFCYCGSERKLKHCHQTRFSQLLKLVKTKF